MTPPKPLPAFKEEILASKTIRDLLSERYGAEKDDTIDRFKSGDDDDLWDFDRVEKAGLPRGIRALADSSRAGR